MAKEYQLISGERVSYLDLSEEEQILAQGTRQQKISVSKKFWEEFSIRSYVKIELMDDPTLFFVDKVQTQGRLQRRISVPQKFWKEF